METEIRMHDKKQASLLSFGYVRNTLPEILKPIEIIRLCFKFYFEKIPEFICYNCTIDNNSGIIKSNDPQKPCFIASKEKWNDNLCHEFAIKYLTYGSNFRFGIINESAFKEIQHAHTNGKSLGFHNVSGPAGCFELHYGSNAFLDILSLKIDCNKYFVPEILPLPHMVSCRTGDTGEMYGFTMTHLNKQLLIKKLIDSNINASNVLQNEDKFINILTSIGVPEINLEEAQYLYCSIKKEIQTFTDMEAHAKLYKEVVKLKNGNKYITFFVNSGHAFKSEKIDPIESFRIFMYWKDPDKLQRFQCLKWI